MANVAFFQASVGSTMAEVKRFKSYPKVGKVTFSFLNQGQRANDGTVSGNTLTFELYEMTAAGVQTQLGSDIVIKAGAQKVVTVISNKPWLVVKGQGIDGSNVVNSGGIAKVDITHNGLQYFGQLDPDAGEKSGYAKVSTTATSANGVGNSDATAWPE